MNDPISTRKHVPLADIDSNHWDENISALREWMPDLAERLQRFQVGGTLELVLSGDELQGMRRNGKSLDTSLLPTHSEEMIETVRKAGQAFETGAEIVTLYGVGPGEVLVLLGDLMGRVRTDRPLTLVGIEADVELLVVGFLSFNWRPALQSGALRFFTGDDWLQQLETWQTENALHHMPSASRSCLAGRPGLPNVIQTTYETQLVQNRERLQARADSANKISVQEDLQAPSRKRYTDPKRMLTTVHDRGVWRDLSVWIAEGMDRNGVESEVVQIEPEPTTRHCRCLQSFLDHTPDILFCINRSSPSVFPSLNEYHIPRIIWQVDDPFTGRKNPYHPDDWVALIAPGFGPEVERCGGKVLGVVAACGPSEVERGETEPSMRCQVGYVGYATDVRPILSQLPGVWVEFVKTVGHAKQENRNRTIGELIEEYSQPLEGRSQIDDILATVAEKSPPGSPLGRVRPEHRLSVLIYAWANSDWRVRAVTALAEFEPHVYGPENWRDLLPTNLQSAYRGPISTRKQLLDFHASCDVNLSLAALQNHPFHSLRLFETPMRGGFLIAERTEGAEALMEPDREMAFFSGLEDLREKVSRWVDDPEGRASVIQSAQNRVLQEHTGAARAQEMLGLLKEKGESLDM